MPSTRKPYCHIPWNHLQIAASGKIFSCCETNNKTVLGNLNQESLESIWKNNEFQKLRSAMEAGEVIPECERCDKIEKIGESSLRQKSLKEWSVPDELPDQPVYLDLRLDNICNFKCRTCSPIYSTTWLAELNSSEPHKKHTVESNQKLEETWQTIFKWLPRIQRIYFAGGEPLLVDLHYRILRELVTIGNHQVQLSYNTNLSVLPKKVLELWNHLPNVFIAASIDGTHERGEFIRKGLNWNDIEANRRQLETSCPHIRFAVDWTVSVYNVFHLPEALSYMLKSGFLKSLDEFCLNFLFEPIHLSPSILNLEERQQLADLYQSSLSLFEDQARVKTIFDRVLDSVQMHDYRSYRINFKVYNKKLDTIRSEDSSKLFPELKNLIRSGI